MLAPSAPLIASRRARLRVGALLAGCLGALLVPGSTLAGGAASIGYAQATGYFKQNTRPTLYQPLNLLDARDMTAWCSPNADPLNEQLTFGFSGPVRIDEIRISTGNNFDEHTWQQFARAKKLIIVAGKEKRTLELEDKRGLQPVPLMPPLTGARFTVELLDQYPAEDPDSPVCLSDFTFVSDGKQLNGPWLTTKLKYDKSTASVLGVWYAGFDGTPDRFLTFHFDGTFRYSYEPFDTNRHQEKSLKGEYEISGNRLVLEVGKKKYPLKVSREPTKKGGSVLLFEGELPEDLKGTFRSQP